MDEQKRTSFPTDIELDDGTIVGLTGPPDMRFLTHWRPESPPGGYEILGQVELADGPEASYPWWAEVWLAEWKSKAE